MPQLQGQRTYTFWDAAHAAEALIAKTVEMDHQAIAANMALGLYWPMFSWRESIADLQPFWVSPGKQDYGPPQVVVPTDFWQLKKAYWKDLMSGINGVPWRYELNVLGDLSDYMDTGPVESICYLPSRRCFRVVPRVPLNFGPPRYLIDGQYKRRAQTYLSDGTTVITKVMAGNIQDALLPSDDMYVAVWIKLMQWAFLELSGSKEAMNMRLQAVAAVQDMADRESVALKAAPIAPGEPIWGGAPGTGFALNNLR